MIEMPHPRAAKYRDTAEAFRRLAGRLHFDFGRRAASMALADEFDRLADYIEGGPGDDGRATRRTDRSQLNGQTARPHACSRIAELVQSRSPRLIISWAAG